MPSQERVAEMAAEEVQGGQIIGLGTGRAATAFLHHLAEKVRRGLRIRGVPTSKATERLARDLGIPLASLDDTPTIDLAVDGADEVDPKLQLVKGLGGALLREKVIATCAKRFIVLVGEEKLSPQLGCRGILPVEVVPFAAGPCRRAIAALGIDSQIRQQGDQHFLTDNGNNILDCRVQPMDNPIELDRRLRRIPGVVETGLFLDMAERVLVETAQGVRVLTRPERSEPCS